MTDGKLQSVYGLDSQDAVTRFYDEWADSYDAELARNRYATPARCAAALAATGIAKDARILDIGCGTGLSGRALAEAGFTRIDGTDPSEGMVAKARDTGVYETLWVGRDDAPPNIAPGTYTAIVAAGVIGPGAAPASLMDACLAGLSPGDWLVFSYNDHAFDMPAYPQKLEQVQSEGRAEVAAQDYGDHLPEIDLNSWVYTLRRL